MAGRDPRPPGVLAYGGPASEAIVRAQALGLRVLADRVNHGEVVLEGLVTER